MKAYGYIACLILGMMLGHILTMQPTPDIEVVTRTDTVTVVQPQVRDSAVVRYVTKRVPVYRNRTDTVSDTVKVVLPIVSKLYRDSNYTAWVSGVDARLDSIKFVNRTEVQRVPQRQKPWSLGVQLGMGYNGERVTPYIGIGINFRLISF